MPIVGHNDLNANKKHKFSEYEKTINAIDAPDVRGCDCILRQEGRP